MQKNEIYYIIIKLNFLAILLCDGNLSFCQVSDSSVPNILLTKQQRLHAFVLANVGNFSARIGKPFGNFSAIDIDKKEISEASLIGKITLVNFWFDACAPCHLEFGYINSIFTRYRSDTTFQVLSFSPDNPVELAKNCVKYNLLFRNLSIPGEVSSNLIGLYHGYPTNYLVDRNGNVSFGYGGIYNDKDLKEVFIPKIDSLISDGR